MIPHSRTIPRLNLPVGTDPKLVSALNRWADEVQTAINTHTSAVSATNKQGQQNTAAVESVPIVTTGTDPTGTPTVTVSPRLPHQPRLPVAPILKTSVPVVGGINNSHVSFKSMLGDLSGDTTTNFVDGGNKRFLHDAMSGATQGVIDITTAIKSTAPVIGHPSPNIGTALAKLNGSGLLLDADQVAGDGSNFRRTSLRLDSEAVENGNFDLGSGTTVPGWAFNFNSTISIDATKAPPYGTNALKVVTNTQFAGALTIASYPVIPGEQYKISGYLLSDGTAQPDIQFQIQTEAGVDVAGAQFAPGSPVAWTAGSATVTVPSNGAKGIVFLTNNTAAGAGTCWFKGIRLQKVRGLDDEVGEGTTYNRFKAVHMYQGGILPAHVNGSLASIDIGTITQIAGLGGFNAVAGWQVRGSATIDLPAGVNSITFTLGGAALVAASAGAFDLGTGAGQGWGVAIFSGAAPASPQANSNGAIAQNSTVTLSAPASGSMTIGFYVFWVAGVHLTLSANGAFFGIHTVLPCAASAIT